MSKGVFRALLVVTALPLFLAASAARARPLDISDEPKANTDCAEHCYILERLVLHGDARKNTVRFVLTGQVLAAGPQIIRLFASASAVGLTEAKLNGAGATIGVAEDAWFVRTAEKRFTLTGVLVHGEETGLTIKGPVNVVDSSVAGGYTVEGAHFTGANDLALHFGKGTKPKEEEPFSDVAGNVDWLMAVPTPHEVARFIDAGETTTFEYRLVFRGPLGVEPIKLPLLNGEKIAEVTGAQYSVADGAVTVHPTGRDVAIRGTLGERATFAVDDQGQNEVLVVHADADHELTLNGNAIVTTAAHTLFADRARSLATRAFRVQSGQKIDLIAKKRDSQSAFAAVVDRHTRAAVWSASGDLVMLDTFAYDNSALDTLRLHTTARPIFLALDGAPERMSRRDGSPPDVLDIPLRVGRHDVVLEALDHRSVRWLGGRLALPIPTHGLAESTATVSLGLPAGVHPVLTTGGDDRARFVAPTRHGIGFGLALLVSLLVFARARSRALATVVGAGAFVLAPGLSAGCAVLGLGLMLVRSNHGRLPMPARFVASAGGVIVSLALAGAAFGIARASEQPAASTDSATAGLASAREATIEDAAGRTWPASAAETIGSNEPIVGGVLQAASSSSLGAELPVELPIPQTTKTVIIRRTLVTRDRPFAPALYYVTDAFFWLVGALWIGSIAGLAWVHRSSLIRARSKVRDLLTPPMALIHSPPMPPQPPYRSAHHGS